MMAQLSVMVKKSLYTLVPGLSDTDGTNPGDKCDPGGDVKGEVNKIKILAVVKRGAEMIDVD